jgi:acyl carrier protein
MNDIKTQVKQYLLENFLMGVGAEEMANDTSFIGKGIIDSTGVLELVAFLESTYGIHVEDAEMLPENLDSLDRIEAYVRRKLGQAGDVRAAQQGG